MLFQSLTTSASINRLSAPGSDQEPEPPIGAAEGFSAFARVANQRHRQTIAFRLSKSGMFWTVRGANAIIAQRRGLFNGWLEGNWERRLAS